MNITHIERLHAHVEATLSTTEATLGYHPNAIEAALLDAVFSARALYGSPTTGVRAVLARWRAHRGVEHGQVEKLDDLGHLAVFAEDPERLGSVLNNRQRVPGNQSTKAEAIALAARALSAVGCARTEHLANADSNHVEACRAAFVAVPGFGGRTWENFTIRSGILTTDSEVVVDEFLAEILTPDEVTSSDRITLVTETAELLGIPPEELTYRMWKSRRERQRDLARAARAS